MGWRKVILCLFLLVFGLFCLAQMNTLDSIEIKADLIELKLSSYERKVDNDILIQKEFNQTNYSNESMNLKGVATINLKRFYENGKIRKAVVEFDCEQVVLYSSYYFSNDSIIFVSKKMITYDHPKWSDSFDKKKHNKLLERFYFDRGKLVKRTYSTGGEYKVKSELANIGNLIIHDAYLYKDY